MISNLGIITPEMNFKAVEMTEQADRNEYMEKYPIIKDMSVIISSDAHYLENMKEAKHTVNVNDNTAKAIVDYFRNLL